MSGTTRPPWATAFFFLALWALAIQAAMAAELPRSTPEKQGIASGAIADFITALDTEIQEVHSVMVLRYGHVVAEGWWAPYHPEFIHTLFSLSKSFTSTAIGLAIDEGLLSLDDQVISFFPEAAPEEPDWRLEAMRIRDLLAMSTGHHGEDLSEFSFDADSPLPEMFLQLPVAHKPGTHFVYNTPATYMCAAILHKVTGQGLLEYLRPRLLHPLGIVEATWSEDAQGIAHGGFGLSITTESTARFGQLYLQQGMWEGQRLLSAEWVDQATSRQTSNGSDPDNDWDQGYGYQFWRSRHGYRGDGAAGQFALILPEYDAVVAINSGTPNMGEVMSIVWDLLLPAMQSEPLADNPAESERLRQQLNGLSLHMPTGDEAGDGNPNWLGRTWQFEENDLDINTLALENRGNRMIVAITTPTGVHEIAIGSGTWAHGRTGLAPGTGALLGEAPQDGHRIAAAGAWTGTDEFTFRLAYTETPRIATIKMRFSEASVALDIENSIGMGQQEPPTLTGTPVSE